MVRRLGIALALGLWLTPATPFSSGVVHAEEPAATSRYVHGIITSVDGDRLTIASTQQTVRGTLDPKRTRVTINGRPGKLSDLKLTAHAKGELCLDDVWVVIDAH
ncbi:MAG: hypothetical protein IPF92_10210 [Myxococcales bacterium]|nr:hypothetical protein [Myxococcales bacterium]MBL0192882.1 hypothetical protein [Myxococcales bacterium]HQY60286.1 hypothetical protein [Polyangiaceae bacterium]